MKQLSFSYDASGVETQHLRAAGQRLLPIIESMKEAHNLGYATKYAPLNVPFDQLLVGHVHELAQKVLSYNPAMVIVVGIGGSNIGTMALLEAFYGTFHNNFHKPLFYCADTIDDDKNTALLHLAERELQKGATVCVVIVSKSGTTTETIINGALYIELLKKYYPQNYTTFVVLITDRNSAFEAIASRYGIPMLEIPAQVGGRYSVLSAVGLFPLALMGISLQELLAGARDMLNRCLNEDIFENSATLSALIIYTQYMQGKTIHDTFLFSPDLALLGAWYKQLVGESLGKSHTIAGELKEIGITPTISLGTVDLHSVAQLYLAGPHDKITTFVWVEHEKKSLLIPFNELIEPLPFLAGKFVSEVKASIYQGVLTVYRKQKRPFVTISLYDKAPYSLGQFLMLKMCEVIFLGALFDINPFDQPAVELYKEATRKILQA